MSEYTNVEKPFLEKLKELKDLQEEISSEFVKVCKNYYKELTKYVDKKN